MLGKYLLRLALLLGIFDLATACSTHSVALAYKPATPPKPVRGDVRIAVGDFTDNRGEPATWLGAIRGGYGNPLKTIEASKSVSELVKDVVREALQARGLFAENAPLVISGWVQKLDGDQYVRKEATAQLQMILSERASQREIISRSVSSNQIAGSFMTMKSGVFGSVEDVRALIERVLSEAVDSFVTSSAFNDAIGGTAVQNAAPSGSLRDLFRIGMPVIDLAAIAPKPMATEESVGAQGQITGRRFTYRADTETLIVTVENGVVTSILVR